MADFFVGLDLGQANDFSALAIVEGIPQYAMETRTVKEGAITYPKQFRVQQAPLLHVRQLERLEPGTRYPDLVRRTVAMLKLPELAKATLIVDGTGVGRGVVDLFKESTIAERVQAVTVTGGEHEHWEQGYFHVPKRNLVASAQVPLQDARLKFAASSPWADLLTRELLNFRVKITAAHDTYGAWREGEHDDLAFAVMLACWWIERQERIRRNEGPPIRSFSMRTFG